MFHVFYLNTVQSRCKI